MNSKERSAGASDIVGFPEVSCRDLTLRGRVVAGQRQQKHYAFDRVFKPADSQLSLYQYSVKPVVEEVLKGFNCTVFAYGQTGTGKTYTMEGLRNPNTNSFRDSEHAGIIPRAVNHIFDGLQKNCAEFLVKMSYIELYNEELIDLLAPDPENASKLRIFEDATMGMTVQNMEETVVKTADEIFEILDTAQCRRKTAETMMNERSSRSHCIFSMVLHMKESDDNGEELLKIGKMHLVDLAGSENISRSGAVSTRRREASHINQSLLTLGRVITALVERTPHIPYRESKLTRILQDSLGGRTKTCIIATITPGSNSMEETLSTLDYAMRAKSVRNTPEVNQKLTKKAVLKDYADTIEKLKQELTRAREKDGVFIALDEYEGLNATAKENEKQLAEKAALLAKMKEDLEHVQVMFGDTKKELSDVQDSLRQTSQDLLRATVQAQAYRADLREVRSDARLFEWIADEQARIEKILAKEAEETQTTAGALVKDVGVMHSKVDRMASVARDNEAAVKSHADGVQSALEQAGASFRDFRDTQLSMVNGMTSGVRDRVSGLQDMFANMLAMTQLNAETANDAIDGALASAASADDDSGATMMAVQKTLRSLKMQAAHQQATQEAMFSLLSKAIGGVQTQVDEYASRMTAETSSYRHKLESEVAAVVASVEQSFVEAGTAIQGGETAVQQCIAESGAVSDEHLSKAIDAVNETLAAVKQVLVTSRAAQQEKVTAAFAECGQAMDGIGESAKQRVGSMQSTMSFFIDAVEKNAEGIRSGTQASIGSVVAHAAEYHTSSFAFCGPIVTEAVSGAGCALEAVSVQVCEHMGSVTEATESLAQDVEQYGVAAADFAGMVSESVLGPVSTGATSAERLAANWRQTDKTGETPEKSRKYTYPEKFTRMPSKQEAMRGPAAVIDIPPTPAQKQRRFTQLRAPLDGSSDAQGSTVGPSTLANTQTISAPESPAILEDSPTSSVEEGTMNDSNCDGGSPFQQVLRSAAENISVAPNVCKSPSSQLGKKTSDEPIVRRSARIPRIALTALRE